MSEPRISVTAALGPAWERTKTLLFKPFDLVTWLVLGFSAWLAGLGGGGGNVNFQFPAGGWSDGGASGWTAEASSAGDAAREAWATLAASGCAALLVVGCVVAVALGVTLLWVSARGKFIFLDNVVHARAHIVEPWKRFRRQGNSYFLFHLALILAALAAVAIVAGGILLAIGGLAGLERLDNVSGLAAVPLVLALAVVILLFVLGFLLLTYFLDGFVVPLMHRYELGVMDGWRRFLALFRSRPWPFLLSGLLLLGLGLAVAFLVIAAGLLTCCIGFLVLMIPYVGTVLLLPIPVFYRAYTLELLAQADPDLLAPAVTEAAVGLR